MAKALPQYPDSDFSDEDLSSVDIAFNKATNHVRKITSKLSASQLLQLYGLYKQATKGNCNNPKPGRFNAQAKQKWVAWKALKDTPKDQAKEKYTQLVQEFDSKWNELGQVKKPGMQETWAAVSSMRHSPEPVLNANELSLIEAAREDCSERVADLLRSRPELKDVADEDGLTALHWAADRNAVGALKSAIKGGCNIDSVDGCGQTPLHYASCCGNIECVKILLEAGASPLIKDEDDSTPLDLASDGDIRKMLQAVTK